mmetsp:Transcript_23177/g.60613  ORF Transcript_23177/g.60613 Transcript_23177/m.60613 type:complete len:336 (-) Transcript_23177:90-1097(-)
MVRPSCPAIRRDCRHVDLGEPVAAGVVRSALLHLAKEHHAVRPPMQLALRPRGVIVGFRRHLAEVEPPPVAEAASERGKSRGEPPGARHRHPKAGGADGAHGALRVSARRRRLVNPETALHRCAVEATHLGRRHPQPGRVRREPLENLGRVPDLVDSDHSRAAPCVVPRCVELLFQPSILGMGVGQLGDGVCRLAGTSPPGALHLPRPRHIDRPLQPLRRGALRVAFGAKVVPPPRGVHVSLRRAPGQRTPFGSRRNALLGAVRRRPFAAHERLVCVPLAAVVVDTVGRRLEEHGLFAPLELAGVAAAMRCLKPLAHRRQCFAGVRAAAKVVGDT